MTDLKEHIATLRERLAFGELNVRWKTATAALDAIEAALFPTGPAPDPAKQFVVGERYAYYGGAVKECLFVFPDGSMGFMERGCSMVSGSYLYPIWRHVSRNPALEAVKAERDYAARRLAELDAKVKEMEGTS